MNDDKFVNGCEIRRVMIKQTPTSSAPVWFVDYRGSNVGSENCEAHAIALAQAVKVIEGRWCLPERV